MITIHPMSVREDGRSLQVLSRVDSRQGSRELWYSCPGEYLESVETERMDAFLVGLALLGMREGEDIRVNGPISEKLAFHLTRHFMPIAALNNPSLKPVQVFGDRVSATAGAGDPIGVGAGYSGGVDSLFVLHDHFLKENSPRYRISHLLFNNVGSHGDFGTAGARRLFHARFERVRGLPEELGLELIPVDSNLSELLQMDFQQTHIPRNVSCALLFQRLLGRYFYGSSVQYRDTKFDPMRDMSRTEAASIHLLSTEAMDCVLAGGAFTRVEKTRRAALVPGSERYLNVCVAPLPEGGNCSACKKCCRTLLTLEMLREVERFGGVFDLGVWRKRRTHFVVGSVLARPRGVLMREILEYAGRSGYRFPLWQRLVGSVVRLVPRRKDRWVRATEAWLRRKKRAWIG